MAGRWTAQPQYAAARSAAVTWLNVLAPEGPDGPGGDSTARRLRSDVGHHRGAEARCALRPGRPLRLARTEYSLNGRDWTVRRTVLPAGDVVLAVHPRTAGNTETEQRLDLRVEVRIRPSSRVHQQVVAEAVPNALGQPFAPTERCMQPPYRLPAFSQLGKWKQFPADPVAPGQRRLTRKWVGHGADRPTSGSIRWSDPKMGHRLWSPSQALPYQAPRLRYPRQWRCTGLSEGGQSLSFGMRRASVSGRLGI